MKSWKIELISLWQVALTFFKPNGMTTYLEVPKAPGQRNVVLGTSSSTMKIWLYPEYLSSILRYSKPSNEATRISATGIGYSSFGVVAFKSPKSMQTLKAQFFIITGTIFPIHSTYLVMQMNLHLRSLSISSLIFDGISGAKRLGVYLTGFLLCFIGSFNSTKFPLNPGISR